ncbi:hypothetical protein [Hymenobacter lucidus]|uniref:Uncharacterized protein n=1 Tax=Hymenobacter lucidus TaxID=2880930 RepID=A0ABS8AQH8_9BACT|nr:hypothetical protein [Hymenobacter lucidus]MCB2406971.1 hypothetical protein [Hymenobacter lucidus]
MLQKLLLTVALLAFGGAAQAQQASPAACRTVRTGHFRVPSDDKVSQDSFVERGPDSQIETAEAGKLKLLYSVKWLDDCTYELRFVKTLKGSREYELPPDAVLTVHILEVTDKAYTSSVTSSFSDMKLDLKMDILPGKPIATPSR